MSVAVGGLVGTDPRVRAALWPGTPCPCCRGVRELLLGGCTSGTSAVPCEAACGRARRPLARGAWNVWKPAFFVTEDRQIQRRQVSGFLLYFSCGHQVAIWSLRSLAAPKPPLGWVLGSHLWARGCWAAWAWQDGTKARGEAVVQLLGVKHLE